MSTTSIEWTSGPNGEPGYTFNPWLGCSKVHAGCTHCYAENHQAVAMRQGGRVRWGEVWQGGQRVVVSDSTWRNPLRWAREAARAGQRRKVFCASLADVLEIPSIPSTETWPRNMLPVERDHAEAAAHAARVQLEEARARIWETIRATATVCRDGSPAGTLPGTLTWSSREGFFQTPGLDWLLLTKRPENWHLVPEDVRPLVWLGTSIADQKTAEDLVPDLLGSQGFRFRFISAEPLAGPVDLRSLKLSPLCLPGGEADGCGQQPLCDAFDRSERCGCTIEGAEPIVWNKLDWVIVGGESGSRARPFDVAWARSIIEQCRDADVACFMKQLGSAPVTSLQPTGNFRTHDGRRQIELSATALELRDHKGGDWGEWPEDLRVRQWPNTMEGHKP